MPTAVAAQGSVSRCRASVPYKDVSELGSGSGLPGVKVSEAAVVRSIAQALAILLCEGHPQEVLAPRPEQQNVSPEGACCQMKDQAVKDSQQRGAHALTTGQ